MAGAAAADSVEIAEVVVAAAVAVVVDAVRAVNRAGNTKITNTAKPF